MKKILILEPYYGGSHKQFLDGLQNHVPAEYVLLSLPARKWKMRMQLSAPYFVDCIKNMPRDKRYFDSVLCSTFLDVAVLKALVQGIEGWNRETKIFTYFHENQFVYPNGEHAPDSHQFSAINFTTALASDSIAFNSEFNRSSFLEGCKGYLRCAADMKLSTCVSDLMKKSCVLSPGIDFTTVDSFSFKKDEDIPTIVWNHRWEHDKNPEEFFEALKTIKKEGVSFKLIVLGESFINQPPCFEWARTYFKDEIVHFGFAKSYEEYCGFLHQADIVVSSAIHEFYGIAVIEGVRAGCRPLLPKRLSYPELFDKKYLYTEGKLAHGLKKILGRVRREGARGKAMTDAYSWKSLAPAYSEWLEIE